MAFISLEIEDSLYQNIKRQGIDIQSKIQEFLENLQDDGYPDITTDEAIQRVHESVTEYRKNGLKNCKIADDAFWDDTEKRLMRRNQKVS